MTNPRRLLTAACACLLLCAAPQAGQAFQSDEGGAKLGSPKSDVPLPPPPAPRPRRTEPEAPAEPAAERSAADHAEAARQLTEEGQYDAAIQAASQAIAAEPQNADYLKLRARAYQLTGRYEQALADTKPLEVVVGAREAKLKSANDVVAVVPQGTVLFVSEVKGDWLKVESVGDEQFKWAWIWKGSLEQGRPQALDEPLGRRTTPTEYYGRRYGGQYYELGRRSGFGRAYYDWTPHVPPQYWRYLPW